MLTAALAIFAYGLEAVLLGSLLPTYRLTPSQAGSVALCNALGLMLASLTAGPLVDRRGVKPALILGLSLITLALLSATQSLRYQMLLAVYLTLGIGGGIVTISANALVSMASSNKRNAALNFVNVFFGLGGIATTYAAAYLTAGAICYAIATMAGLAGIVAAITNVPRASTATGAFQISGLLLSPILISLSCLMFLYVACEVGMWNWLRVYLISIHFDAKAAGGTVSYGFASGLLLGRLLVSQLPGRIPAMALLVSASGLMAIMTFLMLIVSSEAGVTIAVFAAGLSMAPVFPATLSMAGHYFSGNTATAMGMVVTSGWMRLAVSSAVLGSIAQKYSLQQALWLLPALAGCMVLVNLVLSTLISPEDAT